MITAASCSAAYVDPFARTWPGFSTTDPGSSYILYCLAWVGKEYLGDKGENKRTNMEIQCLAGLARLFLFMRKGTKCSYKAFPLPLNKLVFLIFNDFKQNRFIFLHYNDLQDHSFGKAVNVS